MWCATAGLSSSARQPRKALLDKPAVAPARETTNVRLDWPNLLVGAVLGAVASIAFAIIAKLVRSIWNRFPLRALLGNLADNKVPMSVFLRDMKSADGQYYSLGNTVCRPPGDWHNISSVVSRADVEPATDILNLLGQAGRTVNITWRQIDRDGDLWDEAAHLCWRKFKGQYVSHVVYPPILAI